MPDGVVPLAVVVCTLNEEANLPKCLQSVEWASQRFVVDSGSIDRTQAIATELGATVATHGWAGYSDQKNWALDTLAIQHDWVLFLDADEWVPEALAAEIEAVVTQAEAAFTGYYIARRMLFMGRWLKHAWWYPDYNLRLFLRRQGRFERRLVHETVALRGSAGYLINDIVHDDQRDIASYVSRLNRYSSLEAVEILRRARGDEADGDRIRGSLTGNRIHRRRFLKEHIWYRLPMRPVIRFVWRMVFRLGFLDGREGFIFILLQCVSDWHTNAKLYELRSAERMKRLEPTLMPDLTAFRIEPTSHTAFPSARKPTDS
jgi:glycosyltransferase involved in cell wall biosynthesis